MNKDIIIIGGGPAGLSAALYGARAGRNVLIIERAIVGGQQALTESIENYPGTGKGGAGGSELASKMLEQAEEFGTQIVYDTVINIDITHSAKVVETSYSGKYESKTIIIASGRDPKYLNIPGEEEFRGRGVSYCATCDGSFFKGKVVAVVGGGNSALEEAVYLTRFAEKVYIIHRRKEFRAEKAVQDKVMSNNKIECLLEYQPLIISGQNKVEELKIRNIDNSEMLIKVDGVFVYVGQSPNSLLFKDKLLLDNAGYIVTDEAMRTSVKGVFAAGDIRNKSVYQVVTAVGDGAVAAIQADKYMEEIK